MVMLWSETATWIVGSHGPTSEVAFDILPTLFDILPTLWRRPTFADFTGQKCGGGLLSKHFGHHMLQLHISHRLYTKMALDTQAFFYPMLLNCYQTHSMFSWHIYHHFNTLFIFDKQNMLIRWKNVNPKVGICFILLQYIFLCL